MADQLEEGQKVTWNWGSGHPSGTVAEIVEDRAEIKSDKGNTIAKNGTEENPAVVISRKGNDVVKRASELNETDL